MQSSISTSSWTARWRSTDRADRGRRVNDRRNGLCRNSGFGPLTSAVGIASIAKVDRDRGKDHRPGVHYARAKDPYRVPKRYRDGDPRFSWYYVTRGMDAPLRAGLIEHAVGVWFPQLGLAPESPVQPSVDESRGHDMCHGSGSTPSRMARVLCRYISPRWRVRSATVRPGQLGTAALGSVGTTARSRAKSIARQSRNREVSTPNSSAHLNGLMPAVDID